MRELFTAAYTPRRIRFFLLHFAALRGLAEWPAYARDTGQGLAREWRLLAEDSRWDHLDCICHVLNDEPSLARFMGSSAHAATIPAGVATLADLLLAADRLPVRWAATRYVYDLQGDHDPEAGRHDRLRAWEARLADARRRGFPRALDHLPEPWGDPALHPLRTGGGAAAVRLMAATLGWRMRPLDSDAVGTLR